MTLPMPTVEHASKVPAVSSIPVLSREHVRSLVSPREAMRVLEDIYRDYGRVPQILSGPPALVLKPLAADAAAFKVKGAHVPGQQIAGFRMIADRDCDGQEITIDYCWIARSDTGELLGLVEETAMHRLRTAMTGVVAAKWLARPGSRVATIIGAGHIAEEVPACLKEAFELDEVRIVSRRFETARAFAERHRATSPMRAFATVEEAVEGADIVIALSSATEPVLRAAHLAKGVTVCGLGGGSEISADALERADAFVVDELEYSFTIGSVRGWVESGLAREQIASRLTANIGEIATGAKVGRRSPDDVVLAIIQGMACCDVALAHYALQKAVGAGLVNGHGA